MTNTKQQQITELIDQAFTAIGKLQDIVTFEDLKWAEKNWEDNEFAQQLVNLAEDLADSGKAFCVYE